MEEQHTAAEAAPAEAARHPRTLGLSVILIVIPMSVLGAAIGLHMITTLGVTPNTSVIGAVVAMLIGRISFIGITRKMRNVNRQNLVQTSISTATFVAANGLLTPLALPYLLGRPDLVWPMLLGASLGVIIDILVLYRTFGSRLFPQDASWPPGVAAAETLKAGDQGGKQAWLLFGSGAAGFGITALWGLPISAAGIAFIANIWALVMFALGLLIAQYAPTLFEVDLSSLYIPHGIMIGAGLVALVQIGLLIAGRQSTRERALEEAREQEALHDPSLAYTTSRSQLGRALTSGYALFLGGALVLALVGGMMGELSLWGVIGFMLFAAFAALISELLVGLAAMHAGWFPAFAITLIFLIIGLALGFPAVPMALLIGYCAATGPAFADLGYDFKSGWVLRRGQRPYTQFELEGRRQQLISAIVASAVAIGLVALLWQGLFEDDRVPPAAEVYTTTIEAGLGDPQILTQLALWAIPGAIIQLIGGPSRQMGVLFATGLIIATPQAGWVILAALAIRIIWKHYRGEEGQREVAVVGAGLIAGDAVNSIGGMFAR